MNGYRHRAAGVVRRRLPLEGDAEQRNARSLRFFLSPQHARTYEIIRALGRWPFYEKWLEELANQVDRANEGVACADRLVVLDYGAYKPLSVDMTEAAP
ncbi:MAG: hypothetical protein R3D52_06905 [Xanthobacteraceae bacterium]